MVVRVPGGPGGGGRGGPTLLLFGVFTMQPESMASDVLERFGHWFFGQDVYLGFIEAAAAMWAVVWVWRKLRRATGV